MNAAAVQRAPAPGALALAQAARALHAVREGGLTAEDALASLDAARERAATRAILAGSLRWYLRLAPMVDALLRPGQALQPPLHSLLVAACHQLEYSRGHEAVTVNIAVDATRVLQLPATAGLVNALLRRLLREREALRERVDRSEAAACAHPRWLLREIHAQAGELAAQVIAANNEAPPMTLRVNLAKASRAQYLERCEAAGIGADAGMLPATVVLREPVDVEQLPGFMQGDVSVQDAGAQHAALLLDLAPGLRVLDACAAPGGKTGHILECQGDVELTAIDIAPERLARVRENLDRLGFNAQLVVADVGDARWWDGRPYDRILLDAPCSATGVIRRHPDIKLLRRAGDIAGFAAQQLRLLEQCALRLAPGGLLVYATCSLLEAENGAVVERFLAAHPHWSRQRPDLQVLPVPRSCGPHAVTDGFYYACLRREGLDDREGSGAQP